MIAAVNAGHGARHEKNKKGISDPNHPGHSKELTSEEYVAEENKHRIAEDGTIPILEDDIENHNSRILTCCDSLEDDDGGGMKWFIPKEDPISLLFLRRMFTKMYMQQEHQRRLTKNDCQEELSRENLMGLGMKALTAKAVELGRTIEEIEKCMDSENIETMKNSLIDLILEKKAYTPGKCGQCDGRFSAKDSFCKVCGAQRSEAEVPFDFSGDGKNWSIPTEAFQRAFERLFFALGHKEPFDSSQYDRNGDGNISWTEFTYVFRKHRTGDLPDGSDLSALAPQEDHKGRSGSGGFSLSLTWPERLYLTFDNPDTSILAQLIQAFMLTTIVVSSLGFILSTSPNFQNDPEGTDKPKPYKIFDLLENICLTIFLIEYCVRLFTCWSVRGEVVNKETLMELVTGDSALIMSTPSGRLVRFVFAPANVVDFIAIAPGVIGWMIPLEGGGFVVLRLVRLTRIFRAFKNPKVKEPVIVIAQTMKQSTKALYLLGFNGLLGILISGSLMYLVEKGEWDVGDRTYKRYVGRTWDAATGVWQRNLEETPFTSIPEAFWWAVVTATTVGYGDYFPTTTAGYLVATFTMVFSLVVAALPVGVIGGNFSNCWDEVRESSEKRAQQEASDLKFIIEAVQRTDPFQMSKILYIEMWNERLEKGKMNAKRPDLAEFMGQAHVLLKLPDSESYSSGPLTLPLKDGAEGPLPIDLKTSTSSAYYDLCLNAKPLPKRRVTGTITIEYTWTPKNLLPPETNPRISTQASVGPKGDVKLPILQGQLKFRLIRADGIMNLTYKNGIPSGSDPCARVFCYPKAPTANFIHKPVGWRSPSVKSQINPVWGEDASKVFDFDWAETEGDEGEAEATADGRERSRLEDLENSKALVSKLMSQMEEFNRVLKNLNGNLDHSTQLHLATTMEK